jgi:UDP-glucuronate 4-epimerase
MKLLITGSAGFIGFSLVQALIKQGADEIVGIDNINDYYDVNLKFARLKESGIDEQKIHWHNEVTSSKYQGYTFIRMNIEDKIELLHLFQKEKFDVVINLAAQAGVRYSIENPDVYVQTNVVGFLNILECCRTCSVQHLVYASSSSVYGLNEQIPFSEAHGTNHPVSLYAATKKANELMAHTYSHLYSIPTTGLRFFTVYGPWGRPDMAYCLFADAIMKGKPIKVFNNGEMERDFTYIDDVIQGILSVLTKPAQPKAQWNWKAPDPSASTAPYRIYNIGNNAPVKLLHFIRLLESNLGKSADLVMMDMQPGDVEKTWADIDRISDELSYKPITAINSGLKKFAIWYSSYHSLQSLTS